MKTIRFEREEAVGHIVLANPPTDYLDRRYCECLARAVHEASESDVGNGTHALVRGNPDTAESVVGWGRAGSGCNDVGCHHGPVQHGRLHTGFPEHGQGVRSRYRAAGDDFLQSLKKGIP